MLILEDLLEDLSEVGRLLRPRTSWGRSKLRTLMAMLTVGALSARRPIPTSHTLARRALGPRVPPSV